jgi:hypothetical protein
MACPSPTASPPTLSALLGELARLDADEADMLREEVQELEERLTRARAQLDADEAALAQVRADGSKAASDEWALRSSAASGARRAVLLLLVDAGALRAQLERALFLTRMERASGQRRCRVCEGTGKGAPLDAGTSLYWPPCDTCAGEGWVESTTAGATGRSNR